MTNTDTITADDFWGAPIHVYTRANAIEDGVLVDAVEIASDIQFFARVKPAFTSAAYASVTRWDVDDAYYCLCEFRRHLAKMSPAARNQSECEFRFVTEDEVTGDMVYMTLKAVMGTDTDGSATVTFMLPEED